MGVDKRKWNLLWLGWKRENCWSSWAHHSLVRFPPVISFFDLVLVFDSTNSTSWEGPSNGGTCIDTEMPPFLASSFFFPFRIPFALSSSFPIISKFYHSSCPRFLVLLFKRVLFFGWGGRRNFVSLVLKKSHVKEVVWRRMDQGGEFRAQSKVGGERLHSSLTPITIPTYSLINPSTHLPHVPPTPPALPYISIQGGWGIETF